MKFSAAWCGPCKAMKPIWNEVVKSNNNSNIEYVDIDIDVDDATTSQYNVKSIPTTIFFKNDVEVERKSGVVRDLKETAERHLS